LVRTVKKLAQEIAIALGDNAPGQGFHLKPKFVSTAPNGDIGPAELTRDIFFAVA
jgi:hypothetical protein